jgi:hypothetical protein
VVLLAVAVGVLTGSVAFRVTRETPDRGLAADANQQLGADPARPADACPPQQMLAGILARDRNTYPTPLDQAGQAAEPAPTGTLAKEQPSPTAHDTRQPAQTGQVDQRRILSTLGVIATTVVVAMTWRRRGWPHLRERA